MSRTHLTASRGWILERDGAERRIGEPRQCAGIVEREVKRCAVASRPEGAARRLCDGF